MEDVGSVYKIWDEGDVRKRSPGRPNLVYEDYIKLDLKGIGCEIMDWLRIGSSGVPL
jgi:hypothetical protein